MRGVHIRALQELLGHKPLTMNQRLSHLAPEQLQNAVKLLNEVIGKSGIWSGRYPHNLKGRELRIHQFSYFIPPSSNFENFPFVALGLN
jgi:hypothetical protein